MHFKIEYRNFITKYLLPLLGIPNKDVNLQEINPPEKAEKNIYIESDGKQIIFAAKNSSFYKLDYNKQLTNDNISLARSIIQAFMSISQYTFYSGEKAHSKEKHHYFSEIHRERNYEMAIERGICNWITGSKNEHIEHLFNALNQWSVKTYEGKKVTLGFIINPKKSSEFSNNYGTWEDFLHDDFVATLTDCIHSVIELDSECNIIQYLSLTEGNLVGSYSVDNQLPIRFASIIQKYTKDNCVGVFLLNNGDIILSKNQKICLVKRNLRWLNFSYEAFSNVVKASTLSLDDVLIQNIYASMLDVSFAHTGGIIAVVNDIAKLKEPSDELPVLSEFDHLTNGMSLEEVEKYALSKNKQYENDNKKHLCVDKEEIKKRLLKRKVLKELVKDKTFVELDRKLRSELISLDGACILDTSGKICACGAIIKNDSGSSGGGRGAASKKLSSYNNMAIKISTDGYIELYIQGGLKYLIK